MPYAVNSNDKTKIYYEVHGEGYPLVLIMGLGAAGSVWEPHLNEFINHFKCIIIDNRGAGKSDIPETAYTTSVMADDVAAVVDALNITEYYTAGISMGSCIAQKLTLNYPDSVKKLVLISSWSVCDNYTRELFECMKNMRSELSPKVYADYLNVLIYSPEYFNKYSKNPFSDFDDSGYMKLAGFIGQCEACKNHDAYADLNKIRIPVLITSGDSDIFTPYKFSVDINNEIKDSVLSKYENSGHVHHFEYIERFNREVIDFLKEESV